MTSTGREAPENNKDDQYPGGGTMALSLTNIVGTFAAWALTACAILFGAALIALA
jgi:hypothetical protein